MNDISALILLLTVSTEMLLLCVVANRCDVMLDKLSTHQYKQTV